MVNTDDERVEEILDEKLLCVVLLEWREKRSLEEKGWGGALGGVMEVV